LRTKALTEAKPIQEQMLGALHDQSTIFRQQQAAIDELLNIVGGRIAPSIVMLTKGVIEIAIPLFEKAFPVAAIAAGTAQRLLSGKEEWEEEMDEELVQGNKGRARYREMLRVKRARAKVKVKGAPAADKEVSANEGLDVHIDVTVHNPLPTSGEGDSPSASAVVSIG